MKLKKIFKSAAVLLIATMVVTLIAGCADKKPAAQGGESSTQSSKKKLTFGVSLGHTKEERWQKEIGMMNDFAKQNGIELKIQSAEDDANKQLSQCENLISSGIDVLILSPVDSSGSAAITKLAHESKIPVIAYDILSLNGPLDYYISFDSEKVGELQAQFVVDRAPKGNYIWLKGDSGNFNAQLLYKGAEKVLLPLITKGDVKIVSEQWVKGWDPNGALKYVEDALSKTKNDIQGVIAPNDGTAGGAIQALKAQGLAGKVPIGGQDADLAAVQRVVEGTQTGTVYKPISKLNKAAMQLALAVAQGKDPKKEVDASLGVWGKINNGTKDVDSFLNDVVVVTKENMVDTVIKDGYHKLEDVYKNMPKDKWPTVK